MKKYKIKKDKFRNARSGHSTIYAIRCAKCGDNLLVYQKDGIPHQWLKRLYFDRITDFIIQNPNTEYPIYCNSCGTKIAAPMIYKKENRLAFSIIKGTIKKKILYRE